MIKKITLRKLLVEYLILVISKMKECIENFLVTERKREMGWNENILIVLKSLK